MSDTTVEVPRSRRGITPVARRWLPLVYLAINVACLVVVMHADSRVSAVMAAEQRTVPDGVDGVTFFFMAAPALLVALVVNVGWGVNALVDVARRRDWAALGWLGAAFALWVAATLAARMR